MRVVVGLCLLLVPALAGAEPLAVAGKAKVYRGPEGIRVTVVTLQGEEPRRVLLAFAGTETALDGRTLVHTVREAGRGFDLTRGTGEDVWVTLTARETWGSWRSLELHPPGRRGSLNLWYSEEESKTADAQTLLDGWLRRRQSGDRGADERRVAEAAKEVSAVCGAPVRATIDWTGVTPESISRHDYGALCTDGLRGVGALCGDAIGKKAVSEGVKSFVCRFGSAPGVTVSTGIVTFTTTTETPEGDALVRAALLERL